jgi:putative addiction module killer protein
MLTISRTEQFSDWLRGLRDERAKARIAIRIDRLALGHAGDARPVGAGVSELRIDYGPGYRVYFIRRGEAVIVLLCGGDKDSQGRDIAQAKALASTVQGADQR